MTAREQRLLATTLMVAGATLWYTLVYAPLNTQTEAARVEAARLDRLRAEAQTAARQVASEPPKPPTPGQASGGRSGSAPAAGSEWLRLLGEVQARSGARLTGLTRSTGSADAGGGKRAGAAPYELTVTGTFAQVMAFGRDLEALPVGADIRSWQLDRAEGTVPGVTGRYRVGLIPDREPRR